MVRVRVRVIVMVIVRAMGTASARQIRRSLHKRKVLFHLYGPETKKEERPKPLLFSASRLEHAQSLFQLCQTFCTSSLSSSMSISFSMFFTSPSPERVM